MRQPQHPRAGHSALVIFLCTLVPFNSQAVDIIDTVAGGGPNNLPATQAAIANPDGLGVDGAGNIYISAFGDGGVQPRVFKVDAVTGIITIVAGNGTSGFCGDGGLATSACLRGPRGVAVDTAGNVFIADQGNARIRKVNAGTGIITTVAGNGTSATCADGGAATSTCLSNPVGVAVDTVGNLFIAEFSSGLIRKVDAGTGIITTVAGSGVGGFCGDGGPATSACLSRPRDVALDATGNLFIVDRGNQRIRKVDAGTGIITTVAGNGFTSFCGDGGAATSACVSNPNGVAVDTAGNLFIADRNHRIRKVDAGTGIINTVAGNGTFGFCGDGGPATSACLRGPIGVAIDAVGDLFIAQNFHDRIRKVDAVTGIITTFAGNGTESYCGDGFAATGACLRGPRDAALDSVGNLFIADTDNQRVRKVDAGTGIITTVAGNGTAFSFCGDGGPATSACLRRPFGVAVDTAGDLFIADTLNGRIRKVDAGTGIITTVAGNGGFGFCGDGGAATSSCLGFAFGVAVDTAGNLFIADLGNRRVRKVDAGTGIITTVAGNGLVGFSGDGGPATSARLGGPIDVTVDTAGNLFIADALNQNGRIRKVDACTGIISTVAGNGLSGFSGDGGPATSARLGGPNGVHVDAAGNLFIGDTNNQRIRKVDAGTGIINTVAGNGTFGFCGDGGVATSACMAFPINAEVDTAGNLYIPDLGNDRVRKVTVPAPTDTTPPVLTNILVTPNPVATGTELVIQANLDDGTSGSAIASADYTLNAGCPNSMSADDGAFDEAEEDVTATLEAGLPVGVYEVCVSGKDTAANESNAECALLAVYDPNGGFVTGGGWIESPAGAYTPDALLAGKANFGFVSKYKKGANAPIGFTEFQFKAGNLNFHSDTYEWLVVAGARAQFKGVGTINESGNYGFMLTAIDAALTLSTDFDLFRIKIWDNDNGDAVVYDNELSGDDSAEPTTAIGGGSIVIHMPKGKK